jgi:hypothetical protein
MRGFLITRRRWSFRWIGKTTLHSSPLYHPSVDTELMFGPSSRFFAKFPTDKPIQRGSWGICTDEPLFLAPSSAPSHTQDPSLTLSDTNLRVDWQTLRRLPLSGAMVFNFKCLFTPIASLSDEPYIPGLLAKILKEGKKELMEYKGTRGVEHVVIPALEGMEREQIERGVVEEEWEGRTLEAYPWFPGWEGKWRKEQGF